MLARQKIGMVTGKSEGGAKQYCTQEDDDQGSGILHYRLTSGAQRSDTRYRTERLNKNNGFPVQFVSKVCTYMI